MIVLVWIALNISYYGLFLWLPFVFRARAVLDRRLRCCSRYRALSQFPGYFASMWLVERIGRKPTLAISSPRRRVRVRVRSRRHGGRVSSAALFFVGFFNLGAWGAVYPYTAELFPTRLRSSAFGMVEGFGKGAAIGGPYLFGALIDWTGSTVWSLMFVALVMALGAVVVLFGRETRGQKLA